MPPSHLTTVVRKARRSANNRRSSLVVSFNQQIDFKYRDVLLINVHFHIYKKEDLGLLEGFDTFLCG